MVRLDLQSVGGCEKVSPGCAHCYAEELVTGRMGRSGTWGAEGTRERTSDANWRKPLAWERRAQDGLLPDGKTQADHRPRIFCASLADVFEPRPELAPWRLDLFARIAETPSLDWLLLTKRPEEARDWLRRWWDDLGDRWIRVSDRSPESGWGVLPNIWIGTSIENARFTWRADVLREIPAAVRFISAEPLLGSLFSKPERNVFMEGEYGRRTADLVAEGEARRKSLDLTGIDWLIVGGESGGRDARPMHPTWAKELRNACLVSEDEECCGEPIPGDPECCGQPRPTGDRPAFFFKQWGSWAPLTGRQFGDQGLPRDAVPMEGDYGGIRRTSYMVYRGSQPTSGGKHLDGRTWEEFPVADRVPA